MKINIAIALACAGTISASVTAAPAGIAMLGKCQSAPVVSSTHWGDMLLAAEKSVPLNGSRADNRKQLVQMLGLHGGAPDLAKQSPAFRSTFDSIALYSMNSQIIAAQMMFMSHRSDQAIKTSITGQSLDKFLTAATDVPDHFHEESVFVHQRVSEDATVAGRKQLGDLSRYALTAWAVRAVAWSDVLATEASVIGLCNDARLSADDRRRLLGILTKVSAQVKQ